MELEMKRIASMFDAGYWRDCWRLGRRWRLFSEENRNMVYVINK
jgi:hypothetical protein